MDAAMPVSYGFTGDERIAYQERDGLSYLSQLSMIHSRPRFSAMYGFRPTVPKGTQQARPATKQVAHCGRSKWRSLGST